MERKNHENTPLLGFSPNTCQVCGRKRPLIRIRRALYDPSIISWFCWVHIKQAFLFVDGDIDCWELF